MKPIFVLQHEPSSPAGYVQTFLEQKGLKYLTTCMVHVPQLPDLKDLEAVIVLGGEMNVDDESQYPWLRAEKVWLRQALDLGYPMFGICLGAQLMAEVLGAPVHRLPFWEIGWIDIFADSQQKKTVGQFFSWHGYGFVPPKSAEAHLFGRDWLAQGFRYQKSVAVQFHPEADRNFVEDCKESFLKKTLTSINKQTADDWEPLDQRISASHSWLHQELDRWLYSS